jgi:hypothetical protein
MYKVQCVQTHTFAWNLEVAVLYQSVIIIVVLFHIIYTRSRSQQWRRSLIVITAGIIEPVLADNEMAPVVEVHSMRA